MDRISHRTAPNLAPLGEPATTASPQGQAESAPLSREAQVVRGGAGPGSLQARAQALAARLHAVEDGGASWLSFADRAGDVERLARKVGRDGQIDAVDVEALVETAKDFGGITKDERAVLTGLLADRPGAFAPTARVALARFLDVADPLAGQGGRDAPGPAFGSPAFEALLDRDTSSIRRPDNDTRLLFDGVQSFAERSRMIEGAKSSIHLQTFIFTADETGWALARQLAQKADEGVSVRVIYDGWGSVRTDPALFDFLREHGVEVRKYGDPVGQFWDLNNRWHEKHLVVDGKVSIEGGMNIANEYAFGGSGRVVLSRGEQGTEAWRDVDVRLEGTGVHDAQRAFLLNWSELGEPVSDADAAGLFPPARVTEGGPAVRVVQHRPDEEGDTNTKALYLRSIESSEHAIRIENAYFSPSVEVRDALLRAARRGVDVQIITNSRASNDMGFVSDAARYFYDDLVEAGVRIYEKQGGTLHTKTATFDSRFSIVGSVNLNGRSEGLDSEVAVAIDDPGTARSLEERFVDGVGESAEVTRAELRGESFFTNLKQWTLSRLAWTI